MYKLGLDIGIKSVGWSVLDCSENGEPTKIIALGSRIFDAAEQPKTGDSLAEPRRMARGNRRRLRRRAARLIYIRRLFADNGIDIFDKNDDTQIKEKLRNIDVLSKRVEALDKCISEEEFARVLYSIARHRGFKSNKKKGARKEEDGKLLEAINANNAEMKKLNLRTVGEYLYKEYGEKGKAVHNKGGQYNMCVARDDLEREVELLFAKQKEFGNKFATDDNLEKYLTYFTKQRTFDEGPGEGSQYSGSHAVRKCTFYKDEDCAAKGTYSNELSTAYQKINNLKILVDGDRFNLNEEQKAVIINKAHEKETLTYKDVRKLLGYDKNELVTFSVLNYSVRPKKKKDGTIEEVDPFKCEDAKFISLANSNKIRKALPNELKDDNALIDEIAEICTKYTNENLFKEAIANSKIINNRLSNEVIDNLLEIDMKGYGHLSLKALREILPYLKDGDVYSDACDKAGHNHSQFNNEKGKYLGKNQEVREAIDKLTSPVVKRALSQTIKVVDAIIREYGSPYAVNIELAREMAKSRKERDEITKNNNERAADNERIKAQLKEMGLTANSTNVLKKKLYEEQGQKCMYSGKDIVFERLMKDDKYCEIDHIIPYSRSFDDSFNNKVLVFASENQNKKNDIPFEYFERIGRDWTEFESRVKTIYQKRNAKKLELLLKKKFDEEGWKNRALNDTRYITKMLSNLVRDYLIFDEKAKKKCVLTVNGKITAYLRRFWGIQKIREDGDKHHAVDAAVIACVSDKIIQKVTDYNYVKESRMMNDGKYVLEDGEIASAEWYDKKNNFILPYPYSVFRDELAARTLDSVTDMKNRLREIGMSEEYIESAKPFIVSRMSHRKAKGVIHEATVWSSKYVDNKNAKIHNGESIIVKRTPIENLKLDSNGEIKNYFKPNGDIALYNVLKTRLIEFNGDGKKAFATPIYKPCNKDKKPNAIRTVKTYEKYFGGGMKIEKNSGIVANGSMIRVDLYSKDGKYYGVPVYVADLYKGVLPKSAATAGKPRSEWRLIDDTYTFEMSIYPNDLLRIESNKEIKMTKEYTDEFSPKVNEITFMDNIVYYVKFGISTASITIEDVAGCYLAPSVGIQNLKKITKCEIDVLGNVVEIKNKPKSPQPLKLITEQKRREKRKQNK